MTGTRAAITGMIKNTIRVRSAPRAWLPAANIARRGEDQLHFTPGKFGSAGSAISTVLTFVKMFCASSLGTSWVRGVSGWSLSVHLTETLKLQECSDAPPLARTMAFSFASSEVEYEETLPVNVIFTCPPLSLRRNATEILVI